MELNNFISSSFMTKAQELFFRSYVEAIYFTDAGPDDEHNEESELTQSFLLASKIECGKFFNAYHELFKGNTEQAGHDFWLTRNGHGAGFWDRPEIYGEREAEELSRVCSFIGESYPDFE